MGITQLIARGGAQPNISGTIIGGFERKREREEQQRQVGRQETQDVRAEEDRQLNRELTQESIFSKQLENISDRDKARVDSLGKFGREIKPILEEAKLSGDFTQFNSILDKREADIDETNEKFPRLGLDKNETTELRGLVEAGSIDEAIDLSGEAIRIQSLQSAGGGVVGELMDRLKKENPKLTDLQALQQVKGGLKDGTLIDEEGNMVPRGGALGTAGSFKQAEATGTATGKAVVEGGLTPAPSKAEIEGDVSSAKETKKLEAQLKLAPDVKAAVKVAEIEAAERGEALTALNRQLAQFPRLEAVVGRLDELGKVATFTKAGQARDAALRQANLPLGQGAIARADFISTIDNEVLPLLRETFGAAFTENEGQTLKNTLGNPDLSPEEKSVVLKAFINQKAGKIETLQRRVGGEAPDDRPVGELSIEELQAIAGGQ